MSVSQRVVWGIALMAAVTVFSSSALAQEKKIAVNDLPAAVSAAFKAAYPSATIRGASMEVEAGMTYYEIESIDGKTGRDLLYTADGKVCETEETITTETLPEAVKQAVAGTYPHGKIEKAEKTIAQDGTVQYEFKIRDGKKLFELSIDPQGKVLETKEKKSVKKEKEETEETEDKD